jgi:hypothetical protein
MFDTRSPGDIDGGGSLGPIVVGVPSSLKRLMSKSSSPFVRRAHQTFPNTFTDYHETAIRKEQNCFLGRGCTYV